MTPEEQRIKIAEACGWKLEFVAVPDGDEGDVWTKPDGFCGDLPDYLNDLNAMHEAEKLLKPMQWIAYGRKLQALCDESITWPIHATATQRAEALLKTLKLWKNEN